jgi:DNA-binding GntR family transcriptional regulator
MSVDTSEIRAREIGDQILRFIHGANLEPGDQLPSETEMASQIGVSRATIREVYIRLMAQGAIVRRHGRGTFVGQMPIQDDQVFQTGFAASIREAGMTPTVEIISVNRVAVDWGLAREFGVLPGTEVSRLLRLFRANGRPAVLIEDYLAPQIDAEKIDLDRYAMDMITGLVTQVDMTGTHIDTWTTAIALDPEQAGAFELQAGTPVLHVYSVLRPESGGAVCVAWAWFDPSLVELRSSRQINLTRPSVIALATEVSSAMRRARPKMLASKTKKGN